VKTFSIGEDSYAQRSVKSKIQKRQADRKNYEDVQPTLLRLDSGSSNLAARRGATSKFQALACTNMQVFQEKWQEEITNIRGSVQRPTSERSTRAAAKLIIDQPSGRRGSKANEWVTSYSA
jgi:hypothetical protein